MKKIAQSLKNIDREQLIDTFREVAFLTGIAFFPLALSIILKTIELNSWRETYQKIVPGEMLTYTLSFIAPSFYLVIKAIRKQYKLPMIYIFMSIIFFTYITSLVIYIVVKNNYLKNVNMKNHGIDFFFKLAIGVLIISVLCRLYTVYHNRIASSNYAQNRNSEQEDFNGDLLTKIKPQKNGE